MGKLIRSMSKKTLSVFIAIIMVFTLLPITAMSAYAAPRDYGYYLIEGGSTVVGGRPTNLDILVYVDGNLAEDATSRTTVRTKNYDEGTNDNWETRITAWYDPIQQILALYDMTSITYTRTSTGGTDANPNPISTISNNRGTVEFNIRGGNSSQDHESGKIEVYLTSKKSSAFITISRDASNTVTPPPNRLQLLTTL